MRIGIRTKLILLLVGVAFIPLLAALAIIIVGGRQLHLDTFGEGAQACVSSRADVMGMMIENKVGILKSKAHNPLLIKDLSGSSKSGGGGARAPQNTEDIIGDIASGDDMIISLVVANRTGKVVASTSPEDRISVSDSVWWSKCWNDGSGKIYISPVRAGAEGAELDICIPVFERNNVVGAARASFDMKGWLYDCRLAIGRNMLPLQILDREGRIVYDADIRDGDASPGEREHEGSQNMPIEDETGRYIKRDAELLEAYAVVSIPEHFDDIELEMSPLRMVTFIPVSEVQEGMARLSLFFLLIGLLIISAMFFFGLLLVDRSLLSRIRKISRNARLVTEGELQSRANSAWMGTRLLGLDEIDDLARDFNNMVRKLQRSHSELTEANELKENFIRIARHELRTPVSYIVGMANLMKGTRDPDRLLDAIDTMGFKAGRLDEIIQAMFKLIPDQHLREELSCRMIKVSDILDRVRAETKHWIERRKQKLMIEADAGDKSIFADEHKLMDIIMNLAMNAIKFTPNGGTVRIAVSEQLGDRISIAVIDEGPGVPDEDRPYIFQPFYSGSDVLKHSTGKSGYGKKGMGLGLAIAKHFVELHGGTISFSTGPSGSTFTVQMPKYPPGYAPD